MKLELEAAWNKLPLEEDIKALGTPLPLKESKDDEWYIEAVATFSEYRGQGTTNYLTI